MPPHTEYTLTETEYSPKPVLGARVEMGGDGNIIGKTDGNSEAGDRAIIPGIFYGERPVDLARRTVWGRR